MDTTDKPTTLTPMTVLLDVLRRGRKGGPGREKGSVSTCAVCGKPHARNDKNLNTAKYPMHKLAHEEKYVERLQKLDQILKGDLVNLVERGVYNAQEEKIKHVLFMARKEHDTYVPEEKPAEPKARVSAPVKVDEPAVVKGLREILAMLGAKADAENDPVKLITYVKSNLTLVLKK